MRTADALKRRLITIFQRNGRDGRNTRIFEHLDRTQQKFLEANAVLLEGELPVIGSVESEGRWLLITTARIIWRLDKEPQMFPVSEIIKVSADFEALISSGRGKLDMKELQVETFQGKHILPVEPGPPLIGVWNVIKHFAFLNRKIVRDLVESAMDQS